MLRKSETRPSSRRPRAPWSISSCHQLSAFAASTKAGSSSRRPPSRFSSDELDDLLVVLGRGRIEAVGPVRVVGVAVVGARDQRDALAGLAAAARAIAAPARTCSSSGRSRAGLTTTAGTGGSERPPMAHSGISTPQSIGAVAAPGSFAPKLAPTTGMPSSCSATTVSAASSKSTGHESCDLRCVELRERSGERAREDDGEVTLDVHVVRRQHDRRLRPRRVEALAERLRAQRASRPRSRPAPPRSVPCGAIAAKTRLTGASSGVRPAGRGSRRRRCRRRRASSARDRSGARRRRPSGRGRARTRRRSPC